MLFMIEACDSAQLSKPSMLSCSLSLRSASFCLCLFNLFCLRWHLAEFSWLRNLTTSERSTFEVFAGFSSLFGAIAPFLFW